MAELLSVPRSEQAVIPIDAEREKSHRQIVTMAEKIAAIMRAEPDKDIVFDGYKLALTFWRR